MDLWHIQSWKTHILKRFVPSLARDDKLDLLAHVVFNSPEESNRSDHYIGHATPTASRRLMPFL